MMSNGLEPTEAQIKQAKINTLKTVAGPTSVVVSGIGVVVSFVLYPNLIIVFALALMVTVIFTAVAAVVNYIYQYEIEQMAIPEKDRLTRKEVKRLKSYVAARTETTDELARYPHLNENQIIASMENVRKQKSRLNDAGQETEVSFVRDKQGKTHKY